MAITQAISAIPAAGHRGVDGQTVFVQKQEAFQDTLTNTTVTQLNTAFTQLNATEANINSKEASAATAAATATTKANEAISARDIAISAKVAAEAAWDSLDDKYLGAKPTAPLVDNDGNTLVSGTMYYNSTSDTMFVYDAELSSWIINSFIPTSHASLTGLGTDDHTQYHNDTRGDARYYTKTANDTLLNAKQATLVSGTNIKTIGGASILGSGDVNIGVTLATGDIVWSAVAKPSPAYIPITATTQTFSYTAYPELSQALWDGGSGLLNYTNLNNPAYPDGTSSYTMQVPAIADNYMFRASATYTEVKLYKKSSQYAEFTLVHTLTGLTSYTPSGVHTVKPAADGSYFVQTLGVAPWVRVFKRVGDVLSLCTLVGSTLSSVPSIIDCSANGGVIAIGTSTNIHMFNVVSTTVTQIVAPAIVFYSLAVSPDGTKIVGITASSTANIAYYTYNGVALTAQTTLITGYYLTSGLVFDNTGQYLYFLACNAVSPTARGAFVCSNITSTTLGTITVLTNNTPDTTLGTQHNLGYISKNNKYYMAAKPSWTTNGVHYIVPLMTPTKVNNNPSNAMEVFGSTYIIPILSDNVITTSSMATSIMRYAYGTGLTALTQTTDMTTKPYIKTGL